MKALIEKVIINILQALYSPFLFGILLSFFALFLYLFAKHPEEGGNGIKEAVLKWLSYFKNDKLFRRLFFLAFYSTAILFRTLLNRNFGLNPLREVLGSWWIYKTDLNTGETILTTECLENLIMFIPFTFLLFQCREDRRVAKKVNLLSVLWDSLKITGKISLCIEFTQLFLRVGSFQLSDIVYNIIGGTVGAAVYWIYRGINQKLGSED